MTCEPGVCAASWRRWISLRVSCSWSNTTSWVTNPILKAARLATAPDNPAAVGTAPRENLWPDPAISGTSRNEISGFTFCRPTRLNTPGVVVPFTCTSGVVVVNGASGVTLLSTSPVVPDAFPLIVT